MIFFDMSEKLSRAWSIFQLFLRMQTYFFFFFSFFFVDWGYPQHTTSELEPRWIESGERVAVPLPYYPLLGVEYVDFSSCFFSCICGRDDVNHSPHYESVTNWINDINLEYLSSKYLIIRNRSFERERSGEIRERREIFWIIFFKSYTWTY